MNGIDDFTNDSVRMTDSYLLETKQQLDCQNKNKIL